MLALLGEAMVENLKIVYESGKFKVDGVVALATCCVITVCAQCNIFDLLELNFSIPIIGQLFTGVLISRGAEAFHEMIKLLQLKN